MRQWYRSLPAKIACFLLCVLSLAVAVVCVLGGILLADNGFYRVPEGYLTEDYIYNYVWSDACDVVYYVLTEAHTGEFDPFVHYTDYAYDAAATNLRFTLSDGEGTVIDTNLPEDEEVEWRYTFRYSYREEDGRFDLEALSEEEGEGATCTLRVGLAEGLPVSDKYAVTYELIHIAYALRYWIYPIGAVAVLVAILCFLMLMCVAGKRPGEDGIFPGPLNRVPFDLLLGFAVFAFMIAILLITDLLYTGELLMGALLVVLAFFAVTAFLGLCMSVSARIKQKTLLTNTVVFLFGRLVIRLLKGIWRWLVRGAKGIAVFCTKIPMLWSTLIALAASVVLDFLIITMVAEGVDVAIVLWILKNLVFAAVLLYLAWFMLRLKRGGDALAAGDLGYQVDTSGMLGDLKRHGENLNSIADGMSRAVEERLRSERMRSELIANVSHDIKTPLTSIINYAGLMAEEPCDSVNYKAYAEVLVRKSVHLKRLLEDLVEASRAATGNLDMELMPCEAGVLLTQTVGEFEEKCKQAQLELIATQPEESLWILADSRRIWRVFENLMNNACKYSLPGSRVYVNLLAVDGEVLFVFRNTSRAVLNVPAEELTERFVRGDASRSTEGNGLGLSIARSLTERQGGRMEVLTDGDLFKVTLRFPLV